MSKLIETPEEAKARRAENQRRYAEKNKDNSKYKERRAEIDKQHAARHPEKALKTKEWKDNNPDKIHESDRIRRINDPLGVVLKRQKTRAKKYEVNIEDIDFEQAKAMYDACAIKCPGCDTEGVKPTLDHIIPMSKGGSHSTDNIQFICMTCNLIKHDKTIDYRNNYAVKEESKL